MILIRRQQPSGFTLFELLVALSILSVVSTIGATGFFKITGHWNEARMAQRVNQTATLAFAAIAADIENIISHEVGGVGLRGQMADTEDNLRFWRLSFEDDRMTLPVEYADQATGTRKRHIVRYEIDRGGETPRLRRFSGALGTGMSAGKPTAEFPGVTGMRINYFDGQSWRGYWDKNELPRAIRVSLSLMEDMRIDKHLARVATFRVYVQ